MTAAPAPNPAVRFLSWYRGLFARGGKWIAIALLLPCCALSALYGGAQSLGIIETPPTATPAPTRTPRPTSTTRPTDVPTTVPTDAPTDVPPTTVPPTAVPALPTAAPRIQPAAAVPPAEPVDPAPGYDPATNVNCGDFASRSQARAWWHYWRAKGVGNPGGLDGNNDGEACEGN